MAQDLKKLFEEERKKQAFNMRDGHEERFFDKLEAAMPQTKKRNPMVWLQIAATVVVLIGVGAFLFTRNSASDNIKTTTVDRANTEQAQPNISLGDLSPDLQKVEAYYVANINMELASLDVSDENKALVDGYMEQLAELDAEYKKLNQELNEVGPNDQTITALIKNLQLRLQLLQKLKTKLNQLKSSKNEQQSNHII
ncbi:MAG: hypothetical protein CMH48_10720 [Muricauda sp.]|uniref:Anti-sigma factor n=1 Tax=Flagellimonas lutaonensis TaxID=516051 RepID=A0A0D5YQD8_9FLAO|nr:MULTISPECIES: hypothetical protein [Allomuricauda]AKA34083.1 hypothetical protein VC82_402 [Allomuricauda lutaonensis]MBC31306.1 hypothetical protein [Allomuricauda sp.]|tara:strand:- start:503 stop:1093 length:591 start_codon:yes stop_codon:yes gene_type:complete